MRFPASSPTRYVLAAICWSLFVLLWIAVLRGWLGDADHTLMLSLYETRYPTLTNAMIAVTWFGSATALLSLTCVAAGFLLIRGDRASALWLLAIILSGRLMIIAIKALLARARPDLFPYAIIDSGSYPSAHAANSAMTFLSIALSVRGASRRSMWLLALAGLLALPIGISRIYLGVHWPSDVVAGWLFGIGWVALFVPPSRDHSRASRIALRA